MILYRTRTGRPGLVTRAVKAVLRWLRSLDRCPHFDADCRPGKLCDRCWEGHQW